MKRLYALTFCLLALAGTLSARCIEVVEAQELNLTPSPDSSYVAFTRGNDLWVRRTSDSLERRLTFDGGATTLNGYASWVYYEEILGRASQYKAFWWSPDSRRLAFYRFDESQVSVFPIFSPFGVNGSLRSTRYPKAGQSNPEVQIGIIDLQSPEANIVWAGFDPSEDQYFGTPFWSDDSAELYVSREPRLQNTLDLYAVSVADGSLRHVYHEEYPASWVEWIDGMLFTRKGLYMVRNFESGWEQIYFLGYDSSLKRLTDGENWDVRLLKVDEKKSELWFTAKRDSRLHTSLYKLDKKGRVILLSNPEYSIAGVKFSEDGKTFSAIESNARTPYRIVTGSTSRLKLERSAESEEDARSREASPRPEIVTIENDGFTLYGLMSLPKDFDASKKYPVVMQLYGGPGTAYVRDIWADRDASDSWCWENGIIYIVVDPRSSGENGRRGMDQAYRQMTVIEQEDYICWARYLSSRPYVDGSRIGVEGFSFGGTTTAMLVLRHPEYFRCGIAGGGVYDWTLYDTHYTERFMDTPQANPEGYRTASVLSYIPDGVSPDYKPYSLKITHGTGDDNVHFQNTLLLVDALQKAGIKFELMIYPDGMHGYRGAQGAHSREADHDFWTRNLLQQD